jgi:nitrite reductase/ring-hydroxylating ferredoxin subunit
LTVEVAGPNGTGGPDGGPVLGRPPDFPDREAVPVIYRRADGRNASVLAVCRGAELRAYLDLCPHVFLPLTRRGQRVLSGDGERLRCTKHGAEFAVADGPGLSGPGSACGLTSVPLRLEPDGTVRVADGPGTAAG